MITLITISAQLSEKKWQKCKPPGLAGCLSCRALDPRTSWAACCTGSPATAWMSNNQTALTRSSGVTNNFLRRDISRCNYDWGEQHRQGDPACAVGQGMPVLHSAPTTLCASASYTRSVPLLYLSPQVTWKVSLAGGQAKEKKTIRKWSKTRSSLWGSWFTYRLLAHPSKQKLAELPATTARHPNSSKHQTSNVKPNKHPWCLQQTLTMLLVSSLHLSPSWLSISFSVS